jgi:uncharacterized protein YndB with AHSA1/START domain
MRVEVKRLLSATPEEAFDAWLDPASIREWMCPGQIVRTTAQVDARVGGRFRIEMEEAGGARFVHDGEYLELRRPHRLAFTWVSAATGHAASRVTVELSPAGKRTQLVLVHEALPGAEAARMHAEGWTRILERLQERTDEWRRDGSERHDA